MAPWNATIRVVSLNCNGIRSASRKGLFDWLARIDPDIIALQETKAQEYQVPFDAEHLGKYFAVFSDAQRKGYSGVGLYSKHKPDRVHSGLGWPQYDAEGRYVQIDFGELSFGSLYIPSGTMGVARQEWKESFLDLYEGWMLRALRDGRSYIVCGDFNIAHREIDVFNPSAANRITGFLPQERAWIDRALASGWVDAVRVVRPEPGVYTWWSNFQDAFAKNRGWRIDYQLTTPDLRPSIQNAYVYREERFSDHAPLIVEYEVAVSH